MPEVADPPKSSFMDSLIAVAKDAPATAPKNNPEVAAVALSAPPEAKAEAAPAQPAPTKPAPVVAPAAATPAADPDEEILSGKRSPKSDDFRRVKTRASEAQKAADELKAKLEPVEKELTELKKAPKHNADIIKKLESERDDYKGKYDAFIVQFTPEYHAKFDTQIAGVVASLKTSIPEAEVAKLSDWLQAPDNDAKRRAITEITEGLDALQSADVAYALREVRRINAERKESVVKANQTLSDIAKTRQSEQQARQESLAKAFDETLAVIQTDAEKGIPVYKMREGDAAWNKGVEERAKVARAIYTGDFDNDHERAQAAIWSAAAPEILSQFKQTVTAKDSEIATLKDTISKLQGSNPGIASGGGGQPAVKKSFTERMMEGAPS